MIEILDEFFQRHPKVTQSELARVSGVSMATIHRCRRQFFYNPSEETKQKIIRGITILESVDTVSYIALCASALLVLLCIILFVCLFV